MYVCVYVFIISQARPQGNNNCHAVGHPWALPKKRTMIFGNMQCNGDSFILRMHVIHQ